MKRFTFLLLAGCSLLLAAGGARAACQLSSLDGAWRIYAQGGPAQWMTCMVEIAGGTGTVAANRVCEDGSGNSYLTTGGQLSINRVCRIGGFVDTQAGRITIIHSFLDAHSNQVWTGIAAFEADGSTLMFNGVRGLSSNASDADGLSAQLSALLSGVNAARARGQDCGSAGSFPATTPVTWNNLLAQAAQGHSDDMATNNFFSHTGSDGTNVADRVTATGYSWGGVGENIAAGYETTDAVLQAWLSSPGHCANIMRASFREMGAATASNPSSTYRIYWTQVFGAP
jgi:uncharacterized protein YkwD